MFALASVDPGATLGVRKKAAARELWANAAELGDLQSRLHAEGSRSVLVVLQALDTGGKDGTIKHAMSGLNPQGVRMAPFKAPTPTELSHPYLWRIRRALPAPGEIVILNRSHYEDLLVPKVRRTLPDRVIERRYREINKFERKLLEAGTQTIKRSFTSRMTSSVPGSCVASGILQGNGSSLPTTSKRGATGMSTKPPTMRRLPLPQPTSPRGMSSLPTTNGSGNGLSATSS
jgi:hypothetical protein